MRAPDHFRRPERPDHVHDDLAAWMRDTLASGIGESLCPTVSPLVDHLIDRYEARPADPRR